MLPPYSSIQVKRSRRQSVSFVKLQAIERISSSSPRLTFPHSPYGCVVPFKSINFLSDNSKQAAVAAPIENHKFFARLAQESMLIDGKEMRSIQQACSKNRIFAHIGFNERSAASVGCIWNASVLISDEGKILNHHRKLVPTFYEKLVWAPGDGAGLRVVDTKRLGKIGSLICGENTNPLARWALMAQGEQLHVTTWPPVWPTRSVGDASAEADAETQTQSLSAAGRSTASSSSPAETEGQTGNASTGKQYDSLSANRIRTAAHCFEAKCFGVLCSSYMDKEARDMIVKHAPSSAQTLDGTKQGASLFLDPTGAQVGEYIQGEEGVVYADLDLNECVEPKQFHDTVGGYQRFDVFDLKVDRTRRGPETSFETD